MDKQTPTDPASFKRLNTLIYYSQLASPILYAVVIKLVDIDISGESAGVILLPLAGISVILAVTGFFLKSRILSVQPGAAYADVQGRFTSTFVIILAMFEAIAIFGLVLAFLGGGMQVYLNFGVPSFALLLSQYPLLGQLVEKLEEIHRRNPPEE